MPILAFLGIFVWPLTDKGMPLADIFRLFFRQPACKCLLQRHFRLLIYLFHHEIHKYLQTVDWYVIKRKIIEVATLGSQDAHVRLTDVYYTYRPRNIRICLLIK
jgi:hypothetical protein